MRLILKPHPACKKRGELVDIYNEHSDLPWATVHIDTFFTRNESDKDIYATLYSRMEPVEVELSIIEQEQA